MPRWESLFADLEAQAEAVATAERAGEIDERTRGEIGRLRVVDRLRAAEGPVRVRGLGGVSLRGTVVRVGPDWVLLVEETGQEMLLAAHAVQTVAGLGRRSAAPGSEGVVAARLGIRHLLRGIARDRSVVRIVLVDGTVLAGTIERVGADYLEYAEHATGELRRRDAVRELVLVPLTALASVSRWS